MSLHSLNRIPPLELTWIQCMVNAESQALSDAPGHRMYWSLFHLKQRQVKSYTNKMTVYPFLSFLLPFQGKGISEAWLKSRKVLSKTKFLPKPLQSTMLLKKFKKKIQQKAQLRITADSQGNLWRTKTGHGSMNRGYFGSTSRHLKAPICSEIQPANFLLLFLSKIDSSFRQKRK